MTKIKWEEDHSDKVENYSSNECYLILDYKNKQYKLKVYKKMSTAQEIDLVHKLTDFLIKINI